MKVKNEYSIEIGGKKLVAQFTNLADQSDGSVILRYGNTALLATAVMSSNKREGQNWFPLTVDYEERFYAAGQILGSRFIRREGRPSDAAVLSARVVDRTIRPLFNQKIRNDVQIVITVLSIDEDDPDILAINAASLALATSDIPWNGPVSAVRVGKHSDKEDFQINPSYKFRGNDLETLDMIACGRDGKINMVEVGANEKKESLVVEGLERAGTEIEKLQDWQKKIINEIGKEKREIEIEEISEEGKALFEKEIEGEMEKNVFSGKPGKESINALKEKWLEVYKEELPEENKSLASEYFEEKVDEVVHKGALEEEKRVDGRPLDKVRDLEVQAGGISEIVHGSGAFFRGGTHILSVLTLGGPDDVQLLEGMEVQMDKRFFHHYNFPPYSVGETGRVGGFNRRQIGHGSLAEKALSYVIPSKEDFPYTIRMVSEVVASNGSSSMGSICGSSLALMDGGVPIKRPVAGIAMGLMTDGKNHKILTDIQGPEDHFGDMDFKVAGTRKGVTAIQMDVKVDGIPVKVLSDALEGAKKARIHILDEMEKEIPEPRAKISPNAPEIVITKISPDKIGLVIGSGGKTINDIKDKTGAEITIEDDGSVFITGKEGSAEMAKKIIEGMTKEFKVGEKLEGEVVSIVDFGAFVKLSPWADGLVHISEIAPFRIDKVSNYLKEGDRVPVVVKQVDDQGKIKLSIKEADKNLFKDKS